jgi:hypothetical protein
MAFRITKPAMAGLEKQGAHPALEKLWGKYQPMEGQVRKPDSVLQHLCPQAATWLQSDKVSMQMVPLLVLQQEDLVSQHVCSSH